MNFVHCYKLKIMSKGMIVFLATNTIARLSSQNRIDSFFSVHQILFYLALVFLGGERSLNYIYNVKMRPQYLNVFKSQIHEAKWSVSKQKDNPYNRRESLQIKELTRFNLQNNTNLSYSFIPKKKPKNPTQLKNVQKSKQIFLQRRHTDGQKHMKRYSTSLIIREMQIKTTMRNHLTPVRKGVIKKSTNNTCWKRYREKGTLLHCQWECKLVQPL